MFYGSDAEIYHDNIFTISRGLAFILFEIVSACDNDFFIFLYFH